jgi:hypothetical protein
MVNPIPFTGPLKDPRVERFCQEIARGLPIHTAMMKAGYSGSSATSNGKKILERPYVKQRIEEIHLTGITVAEDAPPPKLINPTGRRPDPEPIIEDVDLTKIDTQWVLREAVVAYTAAKAQRLVPTMVKLLELIGRLSGVDKRPVGRPRKDKEPNKGDTSDDKAKPENPLDFASIVEGLSRNRDAAGDESEASVDFDADDEDAAEEV